jgi:hypothetical protein
LTAGSAAVAIVSSSTAEGATRIAPGGASARSTASRATSGATATNSSVIGRTKRSSVR